MSKESVTLPSVIPHEGVDEIRRIVGCATGIYLTPDLLGGFERVNGNGKLTKRIKRNLKRELGVDLDNNTLTGIGNAVNRYSLKDETYLVEYTGDLLSIVGKFSDDDSCFQEGHQNYHHLLAMNDPDAQIDAFCVYRSDGRNMGRAWAFKAEDGAKVFFNAYGLHLDKIGKLASVLHKEPLRSGWIRCNQEIWLNRGGEAYIVGGDVGNTNYRATLKDPDSYAPHQCSDCERPIWNDNVFTVDDQTWCESCYHRRFWICERCGDHFSRNRHRQQRVFGSRQYTHVCRGCAEANYHQCDHCVRDGGEHYWYMRGRLHNYTDREGNDLTLCRDHYHRHTTCHSCDRHIEPGTALDIYIDKYNKQRACGRCATRSNRIIRCNQCNVLAMARNYGTECCRCGSLDISRVTVLIVQDDQPDEIEPESETPAQETASVEIGISMNSRGYFEATERIYAPREQLENVLEETPLFDADGAEVQYRAGCLCAACVDETRRRMRAVADGALPAIEPEIGF